MGLGKSRSPPAILGERLSFLVTALRAPRQFLAECASCDMHGVLADVAAFISIDLQSFLDVAKALPLLEEMHSLSA